MVRLFVRVLDFGQSVKKPDRSSGHRRASTGEGGPYTLKMTYIFELLIGKSLVRAPASDRRSGGVLTAAVNWRIASLGLLGRIASSFLNLASCLSSQKQFAVGFLI